MHRVTLLTLALAVFAWSGCDFGPGPDPGPTPDPGDHRPPVNFNPENPAYQAPPKPVAPSDLAGRRDESSLWQRPDGQCEDPWINDAYAEVVPGTGAPRGKACDPYIYANAAWTDKASLVTAVRQRLGNCGDRWVTKAVMETMGRVAQPFDCDVSQYNGGRWDNYAQLLEGVRARAGKPSPDPSWRILALIANRMDVPGVQFSNGANGHLQQFMEDAERAAIVKAMKDFNRSVYTLAGRSHTIIDVKDLGTVKSLTTVTDGSRPIAVPSVRFQDRPDLEPVTPTTKGYVIDPVDIREQLDRLAPEGSYDAIWVFWPARTNQLGGVALDLRRTAQVSRPRTPSKPHRYKDGSQGAYWGNFAVPQSFPPRRPVESTLLHEFTHMPETFYRWRSSAAREHLRLVPSGSRVGEHEDLVHAAAERYGYKQTRTSVAEQTGRDEWELWDMYADIFRGKFGQAKGFAYGMRDWIWDLGGPRTIR